MPPSYSQPSHAPTPPLATTQEPAYGQSLPGSLPDTRPAQHGTFRPAGVPHDYKAMAEKAEELRRQVMESRINHMTTVQAIHVTYPVADSSGEGIAWTQGWDLY